MLALRRLPIDGAVKQTPECQFEHGGTGGARFGGVQVAFKRFRKARVEPEGDGAACPIRLLRRRFGGNLRLFPFFCHGVHCNWPGP